MSSPVFNTDAKTFWDGCRRGTLMLQRCSACDLYRYPPSSLCHACLSADHQWIQVSGDGRLFTFATVHRALDPYWQGELPYTVAVVELAEGPRLISNLVGIDIDQIEIGMALKVVFEPITEEIVVPRFQACPK